MHGYGFNPTCHVREGEGFDGVVSVVRFIVRQVKFNRFLHPNEHSQRIFQYLVRPFSGHLRFSIFLLSRVFSE